MLGKDLIVQTLLGGGSSGGSSGGGIPQADIDAAFAALAEKGVTVPDGATSADLDDLIASIVTGGNSDISAFEYVEAGTFTPAEDIRSFKPKGYNNDTMYASLFAFSCNYKATGLQTDDFMLGMDVYRTRVGRKKGGNTDGYYPKGDSGGYNCGTSRYFRAGVTYAYVYAYNFEEVTT